MQSFKYQARDPATGKKISSEVQADSIQSASRLIKQQGLTVIDVTPSSESSNGILNRITNRITTKDKVLFSRQLSTLINAGLPLVQSLRNVSSQTQNKALQAIIGKIIVDIEAGSAFSVALSKYPKVFNEVFVSLVAAGEVSGTLDKALERIANQQEKDAEIISKIRGAMVYPAIVIVVMIAVVGFMIVTVMPQVEKIYADLPGANLPLITKILLAVSNFTIKYWYIVLIVLALSIFFTTRWARTMGGKEAIDKAKMKLPVFGPLFMKVYMARITRTGTTLVASGVPLIQMLEIVARAVDNVHIERSVRKAIDKVKGGKSLSDALRGDPNFLSLVPDMIHIGEESGSLEDMLAKTADYYEKEVDNQIKTISTIIEPILMVLLGIVAFTIVAAVLLPVYGLVNQTNIV
ncbi:MAG: type II secretion system F family protein [Candidatus Nomurabacteria bacterium]|nr:MAG: type II secretion system F family protein [Candidatus Nomurabacteria bacterium]